MKRHITGILLCAGDSQRMGFHKLLYRLPNGKTPLTMSFEALITGGVTDMVVVCNAATRESAAALVATAGVPVTLCDGGSTRQQSVYNGLRCAESSGVVVIHDAARCMAGARLVQRCIDSACMYQSGVAAIPIRDTVVHVLERGDRVLPLPREELLRVQTPQAFAYKAILSAYENAETHARVATDDSTLFSAAGNEVRFVEGHTSNRKLTTQEDLVWLEEHLFSATAALDHTDGLRVGYGEDTHLLVPGRKLILGGVDIPFEKGLLGHSDADVLTHAIMDALLGAAGLGDIGRMFPDTDPKYKDISSISLLVHVMRRLRAKGFRVRNVDATVVAEQPKLARFFPELRDVLSEAMHLPIDRIGLKATTTEGVGPEGRGECIRAHAVALICDI